MRKFTLFMFSLLALAFAFPHVAVSQEFEEPIYFDSDGYILSSPDNVRLDVPVVDRKGVRDITCGIPEIMFEGRVAEMFPQVESNCTARVYSNGLVDRLCAVNYNVYRNEQAVSSISSVGSLSYNVRTYSDNYSGYQTISSGSGTIGFSMLGMSCNAVTLGIFDNYCTARNRPIAFKYKFTQYGTYKLHFSISTCTNTGSRVADNWMVSLTGANASFTANSKTCCDGQTHYDYYASSCSGASPVFETDLYIDIVSTIIHAHPEGGEICQGGSKTLSVNAETCLTSITYQWYKDGVAIDGATTRLYDATEAGTYYCMLNDGRATRQTDDAVVTVTQMPEVTLTPDQVICPSGTLNLTMPEGATYSWNGGSTAQTLNVTEPGTYTVTMTVNGCTAEHSFNVTSSPSVDLLENSTAKLCAGSSFTETLTVDNATNIVWNDDASLNETSLQISQAGTYTVAADVNGCHFTDAVVVSTPQYDLIAIEEVEICEGASYQVALNSSEVSNIVWNGDANSNDATMNFTEANTYTVAAQYDGCTFNDTLTLSFTQLPEFDEPANQVLCAGETIDLSMPNGCTAYAWSDNSTAQTLTVATAGTYGVTMTYNGCDFTRSFVIEDAPTYNILADGPISFCYGTTETLSLAVDNATNIVWNNDPANNAETFEISESGTYTVSAKIGECTYTENIQATRTDNVNLITAPTVDFCYGQTETISLAVAATNIVWNNDENENGSTFVANESGIYTVSAVIDGCTYRDTIVATQAPDINLVELDNIQMCNGSSATVSLSVNNANNIVWNGDANENGSSFVVSQVGDYTVVADVDGCQYTDNFTIVASQDYDLISDASIVICSGSTRTLTVLENATDVVWNGTIEQSSLEISEAGQYTVTANIDGCSYSDAIEATISDALIANISADDVACNGGMTTATANVTGGTTPYIYEWNNGVALQALENITAGDYSVTVTDNNGCVATVSKTINQPELLVVSIEAENVACNGGTTTATATVTGGTLPYEYIWNNNLVSQTLGNITAGNYSVTVTDAHNCSVSATKIITEPAAIEASINAGIIACNGETTSAAVNVIGGTGEYTYLWSNAATTQNIENITAGEYGVTVTDESNCSVSTSTTIAQPDALTASIELVNTNACNGVTDATVNVAGGTTPYTFTWSNVAASQTVEGLTTGDYSVIVTDANNCSVSANTSVDLPNGLNVAIEAENVACYGGTTSATANVTGGDEPYVFEWSNGATTPTVAEILAGNYRVTVVDANSCSATANVTITEPENVNLITEETVTFCEGSSVTVTVVDGATNIVWSNDYEGASLNIEVAGTYTVAADVDGCHYTDQVVAEVEELPSLELVEEYSYNITRLDTVIVISAAEGFASYLWSNGSTASSFSISCDTIDFPYSQEVSLTVASESGCTMTQSFTLTITYSPTMINENEGMSWSIAPNPNNGVFDILGPDYDRAEVFAADDRKVCEINGARQDLSNLKPGVYSIKIFAGEEVSVIRFMISR